MKIKLRWGSGKIGGSVCRFNVWRGEKIDGGEGGQIFSPLKLEPA